VITPPSTLYEFYNISPLDALVFSTGIFITIFSTIENGIFAMIILSVCILLIRQFKAHGTFLGRVKIQTHIIENRDNPSSRSHFLPLDRRDGSNPDVRIEKPLAGIFIYRFADGFSFINANHHLGILVEAILADTRPSTVEVFTKPGASLKASTWLLLIDSQDRPWNIPVSRQNTTDDRPVLKAVILDFSGVNNIDLTSMQTLMDVRSQLDKRAAPQRVQWHVASVQNQWTKRGLAAAGFGYPSPLDLENFKPTYDLGESGDASSSSREGAAVRQSGPGDIEMDNYGPPGTKADARMLPLYGINRPFFHPDVQSAVEAAVAAAVPGPANEGRDV
jgi:sodium-independent sulfate anion transporter 11